MPSNIMTNVISTLEPLIRVKVLHFHISNGKTCKKCVMRQKEMLNFRTPQHQSFGTNKWGGASPLLARDIPKESLDQRYLRLNTVREGDCLFLPTTIEEAIFGSPPPTTIGDEVFNSSKHELPAKASRKGLLRKLVGQPQRRSATLGLKPRYKWLPKLKFKKKWPNGWC